MRSTLCRRLRSVSIAGMAAVLLGQQACADEIVLFIWDDYLADEVVERFQEETGHKVKRVIYDSDAQRDEILSSGAGHGFDLIAIESSMAQLFGSNGFLKPLGIADIATGEHIQPRWRQSCHGYGLPYAWGTVGIAWRDDKLAIAPTSWQDLLSPPAEASGHVGMLLDVVDTLIPPLKTLGHSTLTADTDQLRAAFRLLKQQHPHVLHYGYPLSLLADESQRDLLYMALVYSGDQYTMNDGEEGPWRYVVPKEGTSLWVDCIGVASTSTRQAAAIQFLAFINRPDITALNVNKIGYATANGAALPLVDKALLDDTTIYPPTSLIEASDLYDVLDENNLRQRNRILDVISKP